MPPRAALTSAGAKSRAHSRGSAPNGQARGLKRKRVVVDLGLILTALIWGLNFPMVKYVLRELDPLALNALRFPLGTLVCVAILRVMKKRTLPPASDWAGVAGLALIGHIGFQFAFIYGIERAITGNGALLLSTAPVWILILSAFAGRGRVERHAVVGILATLVGMGLMVLGDLDTGRDHDFARARIGEALMLLAAIAWAAFTVLGKRLIHKYGSFEVASWTLVLATPVIVAAGLPALFSTRWSSVGAGTLLGTAYAGILAIALAYSLWYNSIKAIGEAATGVYQNLVPVMALIAAWLWLEETPALLQLAGVAVILGGVVYARGARPAGSRPAVDQREA